MSKCNCGYRWDCIGISVVAGIFVAIITAFLTYSATITLTPAFLWVLFGIGVVYLGLNLLISSNTASAGTGACSCSLVPTLLAGVLGTIITSLILLGITFAATSVLGAIISGVLLGFFTLTLFSTVCLILCKTSCNNVLRV
ncbi:MAG: hypothetical protein IJB70_10155 [Clostridia bacterium]|nr:hypothetical protein [Clostridia bacterium]